jgi:large conductance mechanosensitive channel
MRPFDPVMAMRTTAPTSCPARRYRAAGRANRVLITEASMLDEFKKFLFRGNVVDLAVAVVIGAAFTAIVTAISTGLITPLVGMIVSRDFTKMTFTINDSVFSYGIVIDAVIRFVSVAAVVFFVVVKPLNVIAERRKRGEADEAEVPPTEAELLAEIRDLLAARR